MTEHALAARIGLPLVHGFENGLGSWAAIWGRLPSGVNVEFISYTLRPGTVILRTDKNASYSATLDEALQLFGFSRAEVRMSPVASNPE